MRNRSESGVERPRPLPSVWRVLLRVVCVACATLLAASPPVFAFGPWRASEDNTRGWQFMSPEERIEHQTRVRGFRKYDECHAYQLEHHRLMVERARQQGVQIGEARRDICAHLLPADAAR